MKRLVLTLVAGAFGSLLVLPIAHAQDYQDMSNDANTIHQDQRDIHHDQRDEREDLEHGNLGAAAHEQKDIQRDRANENATKEDLSNDAANHDDDWARHHHHDDDND
jgi:Ni/Co efflux regulator RcnB